MPAPTTPWKGIAPTPERLAQLSLAEARLLSYFTYTSAVRRTVCLSEAAQVIRSTPKAAWEVYRDLNDAGLVFLPGLSLSDPSVRSTVLVGGRVIAPPPPQRTDLGEPKAKKEPFKKANKDGWVRLSKKLTLDPALVPDPALLEQLKDAARVSEELNEVPAEKRDADWLERMAENAEEKAQLLRQIPGDRRCAEEVKRQEAVAEQRRIEAERRRTRVLPRGQLDRKTAAKVRRLTPEQVREEFADRLERKGEEHG